MSLQIAAHQVEGYRVSTTLYEGPLDLLLQLIERAELDITSLALAQVTESYLTHLKAMQASSLNASEVSGFLLIAARLVQIKSAALLPRPPLETTPIEEEDPGEALARQLVIYKRFKEIAVNLNQRETSGLRTFLRVAAPNVKVEGKLDLSGITLSNLVEAANSIFLSQPELPALSQVVAAPRVTIREKIMTIVRLLRHYGSTTFSHFLKQRGDKLEIVVTFLAMLELIKRHVVDANQGQIFGDIEIRATGDWNEKEDPELEFIE